MGLFLQQNRRNSPQALGSLILQENFKDPGMDPGHWIETYFHTVWNRFDGVTERWVPVGTWWSHPDNRWMYERLNEGERKREIQGWPCGGPKFTLRPAGSQNKPRPAFMNAPHRNHHNSGLSQNKSSCAGSVRKCVCLPATAGAVHQRLLTTFYPEYNVPLCLCAVGPNSERERDRQIEEIKSERVSRKTKSNRLKENRT